MTFTSTKLRIAAHSFVWMIFGSSTMILALMWLNRFVESRPKESRVQATFFSSVGATKPKSDRSANEFQQTSKSEQMRSTSGARPPTGLQPSLGSVEGGENFGFELANSSLANANENGGTAGAGDVATGDAAAKERALTEPPTLKYQHPPEYPREARSKGITGGVTADILVDKSGAVSDVRIVSSNPSGLFDSSVMQALRSWVFAPAKSGGAPVEMWVRQNVRFDLN